MFFVIIDKAVFYRNMVNADYAYDQKDDSRGNGGNSVTLDKVGKKKM